MGFGSLGISELVVIFVIVLVAFGPRRFPEIARSMGSAMREFRRSLNQIQRELEEADPRRDLPGKDILDDIRSGKPGNWLDPTRSRSSSPATPGARSAREAAGPEITGETAGSAEAKVADEPLSADARADDVPGDEGSGDAQLPMFDGARSDPPAPPATDDSRSE